MNKLDTGGLKAVVFDWDGTLAETRTPRLWAVNRIMAAYGLPDWESTRDRQNPLLSFMDNFPLVFGARAEAAYAEYAALYKANVARMIKTFPGVRETLAFLTERGIKICIMTNKDRRLRASSAGTRRRMTSPTRRTRCWRCGEWWTRRTYPCKRCGWWATVRSTV